MSKNPKRLFQNPDIVVLLLPVAALMVLGLIEFMDATFHIKGASPSASYYFIQLTYVAAGWPLLLYTALLVPANKNDQEKPALQYDCFINCCIMLAAVALLMIAVDRMFIQKVDYSNGVVAAREYWRAGALERGTPSSILSVLGNLLYPLVFVAAILLTVSYETARWRVARTSIVISIILAQSLITGGRTSILILCIVFTGALLMRKMLRKPMLPKGARLVLGITVLIMALLVVTIFSLRATHNRMHQDEYADALLERHHGEWSDNESEIGTLQGSALAVVVYLVHPKWVLQQVIENSEGLDGYALLYQARVVLVSRFYGLIGMGLDSPVWTHAGNWLSLPGQAFHDFGGAGVILLSIVVWSLLAAVLYAVKRNMQTTARCTSPAIVLIGSMVFGMFVWSPVYSMFDIVEGLYLLFSVVVVMIISKLCGWGRTAYKIHHSFKPARGTPSSQQGTTSC